MTIERRIATRARDLVSKQAETTAAHEKETAYRALCESFPILLRSAGLAQALAYLRAKGGTHGTLYNHFEVQFKELELVGTEALADQVSSRDMGTAQYRFYTEVAAQMALWHKRLAQAFLRQAEKKERP